MKYFDKISFEYQKHLYDFILCSKIANVKVVNFIQIMLVYPNTVSYKISVIIKSNFQKIMALELFLII